MVVLGRITAPHGVHGGLRLHPFGDDPAAWGAMKCWWVGADDQDFSAWQTYSLRTVRQQGKGWVVSLAGIDDRNAAERLVGSFVGAPRGDLPETEPGEFYWGDLIGLEVVNERREPLGRVSEMIESGAHAVMVVTEGEERRLLPFVGQVVKDVDVPAGVICVDWERDW